MALSCGKPHCGMSKDGRYEVHCNCYQCHGKINYPPVKPKKDPKK